MRNLDNIATKLRPYCKSANAPNINTAKLIIRWIYGEADGQGEGYLPYLQSGAWSVCDDVESISVVSRDSLQYNDAQFVRSQMGITPFDIAAVSDEDALQASL